MRLVAETASSPVIRTSISSTSTGTCWTRSNTTWPSAASPATCMSGSPSRIIQMPLRTSSWSSAIAKVILGSRVAGTGLALRSRRRDGGVIQAAAVFLDALAHAGLTAGATADPGRWLVVGAFGDD